MTNITGPVFLRHELGFSVGGVDALEYDKAHPVTGNVVSRKWEGIGDPEPHALVEGEEVPRRFVPVADLYVETAGGFRKLELD
jgi:hypothetical protein